MKRVVSILLAMVLILLATPIIIVGAIDTPKKIEDYSVGDVIEFGSYPQSMVKEESLLLKLDEIKKEWKSYKYYSGTGDLCDGKMAQGDFYFYDDILFKNNKYRAVMIIKYRPDRTSDNSNDHSFLRLNEIYYYKYEPISWKILDPIEGFVLSDMLLDSQPLNNYIYFFENGNRTMNDDYYGDSSCSYYASNYYYSFLREWLNNSFYETSFSANQKDIIKETLCKNTSVYESKYNSYTSMDKVFLLTYDDVSNTNYEFYNSDSRKAKGTDYAISQGLNIYSGHDGSAYWRLRSSYNSLYSMFVDSSGNCMSVYEVNVTSFGIRPAMHINPKYSIPKYYLSEESVVRIDKENSIIHGLYEGITDLSNDIKTENCNLENHETENGFGTGTTIDFVTDEGQIIDKYTLLIYGDINGDGYIDVFDVSLLSSVVNYEISYEEDSAYFLACDLNDDGFVDVFDLSILQSAANYEIQISQIET